MMAFDEERLLFISTIKCCTTSMYSLDGRRIGGYHNRDVPPAVEDYTRFSIHRDPYERAVSLWYDTCVRDTRDRHFFKRAISRMGLDHTNFAHFTLMLMEPSRQVHEYPLKTQTEWQRNLGLDHVLPMYNITAALSELFGREVELPKLNATERHESGWYYSDHARANVEEFYAEDFVTFGYEREG